MKRRNRALLITVATIVFIYCMLGGCSKKKAGPPPMTPEVAVITIQTQPVVTTTELAGRTSAKRIAEVRPQVGGIIQKRLFTEGSNVRAGQALFQIDPALYKAALSNASAALARSEANLSAIQLRTDRMRELLADKAVSKQDYDDASAALKQTQADIQYSKATLETARINLKYTTITAPISGRIGRSSVTEGALVTAQQPLALATIQQLDPMYVDVSQSTADILRLRKQ
ncbi:MAG: efflux RND transporter periplasmic adaptor subunit, partial [Smithella sp.]